MADILGHKLFGTGDTHVIVLADWTASTEVDYHYALPFLDTSKFTLAFVDVRGYGMSSDMIGAYNSDEITSDVMAVADKLGWGNFSLIGHSMTGKVVQKIMARFPDRINKTVAAVPIPASGFPLDDDTFGFFESMATDDEAFQGGMHALTSAIYDSSWPARKLQQNRDTVNSSAIKAYTSMWSKEDFSAEVQGADTPILVMFGAFDNEGLRASANADKFKDWYPNYSEIILQTGHYPMIEAPVAYAKAVHDFLLA